MRVQCVNNMRSVCARCRNIYSINVKYVYVRCSRRLAVFFKYIFARPELPYVYLYVYLYCVCVFVLYTPPYTIYNIHLSCMFYCSELEFYFSQMHITYALRVQKFVRIIFSIFNIIFEFSNIISICGLYRTHQVER